MDNAFKDPHTTLDTGRVARAAQQSVWSAFRGRQGSPRPLYAFLVVLNVVLIVLGLMLGSEPQAEAETAGGSGLYHRSGPGPYPALTGYYWHVAFPTEYSPLVHRGVPLYVGEHLAGRVAAAGVDDGSVWAYYSVLPRYERAMLHSEMDPVRGPGGPRIIVYPKAGAEATPSCPSEQISAPLA